MRSSFLLVFVWLGLAVASLAATVTAEFTSATTIPVTAASYSATGNSVSLSLGFAPPTGTNLTVIKNTGLAFISGQFSNLVHGQAVDLTYSGKSYRFVANYYGGTGNDLILHWAYQDLAAWGYNLNGQLGNNSITNSSEPVLVTQRGVLAGKTVISVAAGDTHSLALCSDGTLAAWGYNVYGQLGNDSTTDSSVPVLVTQSGVLAGKTVVSVATGGAHSLALCSDGTLAAWGLNSYGQLGNNSTTNSSVPVLVNQSGVLAGKTVVSVVVGLSHSLALCSDGTLAAWGWNSNGQLGNNSLISSGVPVLVTRSGVLAGKTLVSLAAGRHNSVALCSDGTLAAWGYNLNGQLGNGSTTSSSVPVLVTQSGVLAGKTVVAVSVGGRHSLALCSDGTLAAWGYNFYGQLSNGSTAISSSFPVLVTRSGVLSGKTVVSVEAGDSHSLALCSDGTLASWGDNGSGQLGNDSTTSSSVPVLVTRSGVLAGNNVVSVAAGGSRSLVLCARLPAAVSSLKQVLVNSMLIVSSFDDIFSPKVQISTSVRSVIVNPTALDPNATVKVNGIDLVYGSSGLEIPVGDADAAIGMVVTAEDGSKTTYTIHLLRPSSIEFVYSSAVQIPASYPAYDATGLDVNLSLGFAPTRGTNLMVVKNTGTDFIKGTFNNLAQGQVVNLAYNGVVYRFVANYYGGSGNDLVLHSAYQDLTAWNGSMTDSSVPVLVAQSGVLAGKTVVSVAAADSHSLALCSDGTLAAWGNNGSGKLGDGSTTHSGVPVLVTQSGVLAGKTVVSVAAGGSHSLVLCSDGTLAAWGSNYSGELGNGSTAYSSSFPVLVTRSGVLAGKTVVSVAAGGSHSLALCSDGTLAAWGDNYSGELGNGSTASSNVPVLVTQSGVLSGKTVVSVAVGDSHSLALCSDGTLAAWGYNVSGQLGNGSRSDSNVPVLVTQSGVLAGKAVVSMAAGGSHNLALCSDGTLAAWGQNFSGQLGDGSTTSSSVPVLVTRSGVLAGNNVVSVSAGGSHSLALCSDGTLAEWGYNLGNVPVLVAQSGVLSGKTVVSVSAGGSRSLALCARLPAAVSSLKQVLVNSMLIVSPFDDIFSPKVQISTSVRSVIVNPTALDPNATVKVNGIDLVYGSSGLEIPVGDADAAIGIVVTAEDGSTTTYTIHLLRPSSIEFVYSSAVQIPASYPAYDATGLDVNLSLGFAPTRGTNLMVVKNTGTDFIKGTFNNLAQGQVVNLAYNGVVYRFVANYYGGSGNDLVLHWAYQELTAWGNNGSGRLGNGSKIDSGVPVLVTQSGVLAGKTVVSVAAGSFHSLALCSDGTLAAWGNNGSGKLGDGSTTDSGVPVLVTQSGVLSGKTVVSVAVGDSHSLALCSDGTLAAWGDNFAGRLGNGSKPSSSVPVLVTQSGVLAGKTVVSVAAGDSYSLALCSDGTLAAWGNNGSGQLGNGSTSDSNVPVLVIRSGVLSGKTVVSVSAGGSHSLALCSDGTLAAWGDNVSGQIGNGSTTSSRVPVLVTQSGVLSGKTVVSVSAGGLQSLALCSDGTLAAWGDNVSGQIGNGSTTSTNVPVLVTQSGVLADKTVASVSAGGSHNLALCSDGTLAAWGSNFSGRLGNGSTTRSDVPVLVPQSGVLAGKTVISVAAGVSHSLALCARLSSAVSTLKQVFINDMLIIAPFDDIFSPKVRISTSVRSVIVNPTALDPNATVKVNGIDVVYGSSGLEIPVGEADAAIGIVVTAEDGSTTTYTIHLLRPSSIEFVYSSAVQIPASYPAYDATGLDVNLSLGFAPTRGTNLMVVKNTGTDFIKGTFNNLTQGQVVNLAYNGVVYRFVANYYGGSGNDLVLHWAYQDLTAWGNNGSGRLGNGSTTDSGVPVLVAQSGVLAGKTVVSVAVGESHSLALCSDGTLAAWGYNVYGQLGNDSTTDSSVPVLVTQSGVLAGKTVVSVAAGGSHSLALCSDGTLAAWGSNYSGELGNGITAYSSSFPVLVTRSGVLAGKTVVSVSAGGLHSLALCSDGTLAAWGGNDSGQLGNGSGTSSNVPVLVTQSGVLAGKNVVSVSAGVSHSLALCSDGTLAAWGYNYSGQLGNGSTTRSDVPVLVTQSGVLAGKNVVSVSAGGLHSLALCSDGTLAAWGDNYYGELGKDSTASSNVPVLVTRSGVLAGKNVVSVSAADFHSLALCSDGTLAAWGYNVSGQLGNGSTSDSNVPVLVTQSGVLAGKSVVSMAAGFSHSLAIAAVDNLSSLGGLELSAGVLSPNFNSATTAYTANVPSVTDSILVTPTPYNSMAQVEVNGNLLTSVLPSHSVPLLVGTNTIIVKLTAPDGTSTSTYKVTVTRAPSAVSSLAGLSLSAGVLGLEFASDGTSYTASVPNIITAVTVSLTITDSTASVKINGVAVASGAASPSIPLAVGNNTIGVVVTAQDETTTSAYTVTVTRAPSTVSSLAGLALSSGTLSPSFSTGTLAYTAIALSSVKSLQVTPLVTDSTASVKINGVAAVSGSASSPISLTAGNNLIQVVVTAQDGSTTSSYTVTVFLPSAVATLSGLTCNTGSLSPTFSSGTAAYAVSVANDCTGVTLTPMVTEPNATVRVNGALVSSGTASAKIPVVVVGSNVINVAVTAQDGTTIQTYAVTVTRPPLNATFASAVTLPLSVASYDASGNFANLSLGYAPTAGTTLTLVKVTGLGFIQGRFSNLAQGQLVSMTYQGEIYPFVVNYYGGTGDDLVLQWANDKTYAWGANSYGQLGNNGTSNSSLPTSVLSSGALSGKCVVAVAAGSFHSLALCADGTLAAWGRNDFGQLGNNSTTQSNVPINITNSGVLSGKTVVAISAGYYHNLALCSDGTVAAWGQNTYGQLGDGTNTNSSVPVAVTTAGGLSGKSVSGIVAGYYHNLAQCTDGSLVAWGRNTYGQLGNNSTTDSSAPVDITSSGVLSGRAVMQFAAGSDHSLVMCSDGSLEAWGRNNYGQLGNGSSTSSVSTVPVGVDETDVLAGKVVVAIATGGWHNLALCLDGTLAGFGRNNNGQLGDGGTTDQSLPVVSNMGSLGGRAITALEAANSHSLALCTDGSTYAWGSSSNGQLGNGGTTSSSLPVAVTTSPLGSGERFMTLATGTSASHSMALTAIPRSSKTTPTVTSVTATSITYGAALSSSTLAGTNSTVGVLAFTTPATIPTAGTASQAWTFTPTDSANYKTVTGTVNVTVNKATASVTLASLAQTYNGSAKSATSTTSPSGLSVTYTYNGSATVPTTAGNYTVVGTIGDTNYTGSATGTLVISKATPTVTTAPVASAITYGQTLASSTLSGGVGSVPGSFAFTTPSTKPNAGVALQGYTFTPTDSTNFNKVTGNVSVTVNQATATVTLGSLAQTYNGSSKSATSMTSPSGLSVTYTYNGSATEPTTAGNYTVVGTIGNTNYTGSTTGTLVISKATPTVTTAPVASAITYGQTLASSTLSGGVGSVPSAFAFTLPSTSPATGTASQGYTFRPTDSINYNTVTGTVSVTVTKATATVTLASLAQTYNGSAKSATSTTSPSGLSVTYTYNGSATAPTTAGNYTVVGTIGDTNYTGSATGTLVISKATPTVTTAPVALAITYGQTLASSTLSGGVGSVPGSFAFTTPSTKPNAGVAPQGYTFTPTDSTNYNKVTGNVSVTVNKATATVTLGSLAQTYNGSSKSAASMTSPSGLSVTYTYNGAAAAPIAAGSYTVVATIGDTNYTGSATGTLVISKATPTVTTVPVASAIAYGQTLASSTLNGGVGSVPGTFAFTVPSTAPVTGTASQGYTFTPADSTNYNTVTGTMSVTVNKSNATVTLGSLAQTYNVSAKSATSTTSPSGLSVTYTYNGSATVPTTAGNYTVVGTIGDTNYTGSATGTLVISKATPTVTTAPVASAITYGQTLASSTLSGGVGSVPGTFAFTVPSTAPVTGTASQGYTFTPADSTNYNTVTGTVSVTVTKATATVTLASLAQTYNGSAKSATSTTSPSGLSVTYTYNGSATVPTTAGNYTVVGTIGDTNYTGSATGTLVISKATPTVTTAPVASAITYGQTLASSTLSGGVGSVPGSFAFTTPSTKPNAGVAPQGYTFTPTDSTNYNKVTGNVSVTVNKATATVTLASLAQTYNGSAKSATSTTSPSGLSVTYTYNGTVTAPIAVGSYTVVATIGDTNYKGSATGTLVISKATPTVTTAPVALAITYGQTLASSTLSGGVGSVPGSFAFTTPSTKPNAGVAPQGYTFRPTDSTNYNTVTGTVSVTVNKATAMVTLASLAQTYNGSAKSAISTTSPSGLSVTYTYNGAAAAPIAAGSYTVVATIGDTNYKGSATGTLVISKATPTVTTAPVASAITYGQTLASSTLSGGVGSVAGSFAFTTPSTKPNAGVALQGYTFTPTDSTNYNTVTGNVSVTVNKATATVTLGSLAQTYNGSAKSATSTTSPSGLSVTYTYNGAAAAPIAVGSYTVVATIGDTNYKGSATGTLVISKAALTVTTASVASAITYSQTLASSTLSGGVESVAGTFQGLLKANGSGLPVGMVSVIVSAPGTWSASLDLAGSSKVLSAKGTFSLDPSQAAVDLTIPFSAAMMVHLRLDPSSALVSGDYPQGIVEGFRMASGSELPTRNQLFTLTIDQGPQDGMTIPAGLGWATGTVSNKGAIALTGQLGDGKAFTMSTQLSATGQAILWLKPYSNLNSFVGGIVSLRDRGLVSNGSDTPLTEGLCWYRVADSKEPSYPNGFGPLQVDAGIAPYAVPANAAVLATSLGLPTTTFPNVIIDGGGLPDSITASLPTSMTLDTSFKLNAVKKVGQTLLPWAGSVNKANGSFSGTLTLPTSTSTSDVLAGAATVSGVLLEGSYFSPYVGSGLVKIPLKSPKGSFRTAAMVTSKETP